MNTKSLFFCLAALLTPRLLWAEVKLPSLFTDNMVFQQQAACAVWGWAKAGSTISVAPSWGKQKYTTQTDAAGKWKLKVATPKAGGPYQLTISDGKPLTLKNVLVGEVWLCTGQSNMEMPMKGFKGQPILNANEAILKSSNPNIRLYNVPRNSRTEPKDNSKPFSWKVAEPEAVSNFSATGYYFGRLLNEMLHVPVGLINCSYGGSTIEAWMNAETLRQFVGVAIPLKTDSIKVVNRTPTTLYNGMLHPVVGYGIRGIIWYQGESNYEHPDEYPARLAALVKEWRTEWSLGDFPFYYAQIAPYNYAQLPPYNKGGKFNSAFLRDAQRKAESQIPNAAMAVLLDVGEENSIHPMRKEPGGTRLALLALTKTYGLRGFGAISPAYESMEVKDGAVAVKFKDAPNGMSSFGQELAGFEVAGADQKFYPAKAAINGSVITVSSEAVKAPVAVRYAFQDFTRATLFSNEGLPVSSFRTDDWAQ